MGIAVGKRDRRGKANTIMAINNNTLKRNSKVESESHSMNEKPPLNS